MAIEGFGCECGFKGSMKVRLGGLEGVHIMAVNERMKEGFEGWPAVDCVIKVLFFNIAFDLKQPDTLTVIKIFLLTIDLAVL